MKLGRQERVRMLRHPPARVVETYPATDVKDLGDGACLIAFPVNVSGWMRLALHGQRAGDVISFRYDERAAGIPGWDFEAVRTAARVCEGR